MRLTIIVSMLLVFQLPALADWIDDLPNVITFDNLAVSQVVDNTHYLNRGVVFKSQPTGYLVAESSKLSTGQYLSVVGNGVDRKVLDISFFLPNGTPGEISEFYTLIRAPGWFNADYYNASGELMGVYPPRNEVGLGISPVGGMNAHRILIFTDLPWADLSIDDFRYSNIEAVPEPASLLAIGGGFSALLILKRRK